MNIFDYLKDIFVGKKGILPTDEYVPYLITRWLSFSTGQVCCFLNNTVNILGSLDKNTHYKLLITLIPKVKYQPRIKYIKRLKKEETDTDKDIILLARSMERSTKEIKQLVALKQSLQ